MMHESREIMIDDLKIYSDGLVNALKKEKLADAREYVANMKGLLDDVGKYVEANISYETVERQSDEPLDKARTDAERAMDAAKRAQEKAVRLDRAARDTDEESKRLKKAAGSARKESEKAWKAAEKAEKAESKAEKEAKKAAEQASKANQAARRS